MEGGLLLTLLVVIRIMTCFLSIVHFPVFLVPSKFYRFIINLKFGMKKDKNLEYILKSVCLILDK